MNEKTELRLKEQMKRYDAEKFDLFLAELGWEDWMNEYTEAGDGEEITEAEGKEIDQELKKLWDEVHGEE